MRIADKVIPIMQAIFLPKPTFSDFKTNLPYNAAKYIEKYCDALFQRELRAAAHNFYKGAGIKTRTSIIQYDGKIINNSKSKN